ncbi:MAG: hypothetical protein GY844_35800 [Bradyrhizobium sp.]|nr:hypothetical protein [Bradyrhizobium sp.]
MKRSVGAIGLLVVCNLMGMSKPSLATHICWIDHVARASGGVHIYFAKPAVLRVAVTGKSPESSDSYIVANGVLEDGAGRARDYLFARDGDEIYAAQLSHDICTYQVSTNDVVGAVKARSAMKLPGLEPLFTTQTVRTDGTVSETETSR